MFQSEKDKANRMEKEDETAGKNGGKPEKERRDSLFHAEER